MNEFEAPWKLDNYIRGDIMMAERALMLTPAPTLASLDWKRKRAKHTWYRADDGAVDREIQLAIDADQNWLDTHPARQRTTKRRPQ